MIVLGERVLGEDLELIPLLEDLDRVMTGCIIYQFYPCIHVKWGTYLFLIPKQLYILSNL